MDEVEAIEAIVVVVEFISRRRFSPPFGMAPASRKWRQGVPRNLKRSKLPRLHVLGKDILLTTYGMCLGRRNRTLHLYEMTWPTNLLVFGFGRAKGRRTVCG